MSILVKNIKYLRKKLGLTQETFAQAIDINRPSVGAYEEGRAEPKLVNLAKIAKLFDVSIDDLLNQDLSKTDIMTSANLKVLAVTVDESETENIELVPVKAAAGYLNGYADTEFVSELPKVHIPTLPKGNTYRAFEISGDSMLPIIPNSLIVGKYLENTNEIKEGKTYILTTKDEGIVYKRVFYNKNELVLASDNQFYTPYKVNISDLLEIWEACAVVSSKLPDFTYSKKEILSKI